MPDPKADGYRFDTLAVHAGAAHFTIDGAHPTAPPIVHASSYWYDSADDLDRVLGDEQPGFSYARYASPTVVAFEEAVAALEGGPRAVAFGSGMAAVHATIRACAPGHADVVFASQDCYGGTFTLLASTLAREGLDVRFVDVFELDALEERFAAERPLALLFEVISNPLERVADLEGLISLARRYDVRLIVDSTFTTPFLLRPLSLGADFVLHSATKYLAGHGDVTGGVVVCATEEDAATLVNWRKYTGAVLGAHDAYLALRGVRTLGLRMARQCANASAVARALEADTRVERVFFPGLASDPDHRVAARHMPEGVYGAMLAFALRGAGRPEAMRYMERLRLVRAAPTLGDCYSLILYPVIASHRGLTPAQRAERGIHDNVLRFSAGIEDPADLIHDLRQAL